MDKQLLLNERQVSQIIGMSIPWLRRCRQEGPGIPFRKIGRSVRYLTQDVYDWVAEAVAS